MFQAIRDIVAFKIVELVTENENGLIIPATAAGTVKHGFVVSVGSECEAVEVGDVVAFEAGCDLIVVDIEAGIHVMPEKFFLGTVSGGEMLSDD